MAGCYWYATLKKLIMSKFIQIEQICTNENNFSNLRSLMNILDDLNIILSNCLSDKISNFARVGAYDAKERLAVVYVSDQQMLTTIRNSSENLIRLFNKSNFNIDKILIKVSMNFNNINNDLEQEINL